MKMSTFNRAQFQFFFLNFRPNEQPSIHIHPCSTRNHYKPIQVGFHLMFASFHSYEHDQRMFCIGIYHEQIAWISSKCSYHQCKH